MVTFRISLAVAHGRRDARQKPVGTIGQRRFHMSKAPDSASVRSLQRRKTTAIVPSMIIDHLRKAQAKVMEELKALKVYLGTASEMTHAEYRVKTASAKRAEGKEKAWKVHLAIREAEMIRQYLEEQKGAPEERISAQQRLAELAEVSRGITGEREEEEEPKEKHGETVHTEMPVDLGLVTRLAGSGIRVGPMQFRLIGGQLERTYMNIVRISTDKEDTKKFVRAVRKFFLPPGRTLSSVGITEKWLANRGYTEKESEELLG